MRTELARTVRAAIVAAVVAFAAVAGIGAFLGFPAGPSLVAGLVAAALGLLLVVGAARRSGSLDRDDLPPPT